MANAFEQYEAAGLPPSDKQQSGFNFPQPLSERYAPQAVSEFVGLEKPKKIMSTFIAAPYRSAWRFVGPSGTGKTTMAFAICKAIAAETHHITSQSCTVDEVRRVVNLCHHYPRLADWTPGKFHGVIVDEADQMSNAAQLSFLSILDETAFPPETVFFFTCNSIDRFEARFLSRTRPVEFSSYGLSEGIQGLLARIWDAETGGNNADRPNFARVAKESNNNVRDAIMQVEVALMSL